LEGFPRGRSSRQGQGSRPMNECVSDGCRGSESEPYSVPDYDCAGNPAIAGGVRPSAADLCVNDDLSHANQSALGALRFAGSVLRPAPLASRYPFCGSGTSKLRYFLLLPPVPFENRYSSSFLNLYVSFFRLPQNYLATGVSGASGIAVSAAIFQEPSACFL